MSETLRMERDYHILREILISTEKVVTFAKPFTDADSWNMDAKSFDAVLMNFVIIGECVIRLSDELKEAHSHIPWGKIKRFRNLVAHDYFGIDAEEVWQIAQVNIPKLRADILQILALE